MSIDTRQKRMSAMSPASVWRGPMVDASEMGFSADNRAAADFMYSGEFAGPPVGASGVYIAQILNVGSLLCRG